MTFDVFPEVEKGAGMHQMSSADNEDHAFDTSSLRHLKVFERLHA
jgi:hypothetical protein